MFPARSPASRRTMEPAPDHENTWTGGIDDAAPFFVFADRRECPAAAHRSLNDPDGMMQAPMHPTTYARPAADLAVPGTRPSCAVNPPPPLFIAASHIGKDGRGRTSPRTGGIHRFRATWQDGWDQGDQRGRAVACA